MKEPTVSIEKVAQVDNVERVRRVLRIKNDFIRCILAEFFCTALLIFSGLCVNAQFILSKGAENNWTGITIGWGFSVAFAVYGGANISGSHLNPAVSAFIFTMGHLSAVRLCAYVVAQTLGAFVGAMFTFFIYYDALNNFDGGVRYVTGPLATANIFSTYPKPYLTVLGGFFDQVIGTGFLCICVCIIIDKNNKIPQYLQPLLIGFVVSLICATVGMNCGCPVNPARDLGPRLFTLCAGWGLETFSFRNYTWFWIPIVGPIVGGVVGAWTYVLFLGIHRTDIDVIPKSTKPRNDLEEPKWKEQIDGKTDLSDL